MGEKGKLLGKTAAPELVAATRRREIAEAALFIGVEFVALDFPDGELPFIELRKLVDAVLPLVRMHASAAIFSFHPHEVTPDIHHSDHAIVGRVAEVVATLADVNEYQPYNPENRVLWDELLPRPEYWVWYSGWLMVQAAYLQPDELIIFEQSEQDRSEQLDYLNRYHASQTLPESRETWRKILDRVSLNRRTGKHEEHYLRVR